MKTKMNLVIVGLGLVTLAGPAIQTAIAADGLAETVCAENPGADIWDCKKTVLKVEHDGNAKVQLGVALKGNRLNTLAKKLGQEIRDLKKSGHYTDVVESLGAEDFTLDVHTFKVLSKSGQLDWVDVAQVAAMQPAVSRQDYDWMPAETHGEQIQKTPDNLADVLVPNVYGDSDGSELELKLMLSELAATVHTDFLHAVARQPNVVIMHVNHSSEPGCNMTGCASTVILDKFNGEGLVLQQCDQYR